MTRSEAVSRADALYEAIERSPFGMTAERQELEMLRALIDRMDEPAKRRKGKAA
jgi:hypothetical protein